MTILSVFIGRSFYHYAPGELLAVPERQCDSGVMGSCPKYCRTPGLGQRGHGTALSGHSVALSLFGPQDSCREYKSSFALKHQHPLWKRLLLIEAQ